MPKANLITDLVAQTGAEVKRLMADAGIENVEAMKKTVLGLIQAELGAELKDLQNVIARTVMQQIPQGSLFSPGRGKEYDPEVGLRSLSKDQLEELKKKMLFVIHPEGIRQHIDQQTAMMSPERKGFFNGATAKDLQIQVGASGGFLVPTEFMSEVLRRLVKISTFRNQCRFYGGVGMKGSMPRETNTVSITYEGEAQTIPTTDFALGEITWSLSKRTALTKLSRELYNFSAIDVLTLLATMFSEQDQFKDDDVFMNGTGKGMPMGLRVERNGMNTTAITGASLDWTDLTALKHSLKIQYRNEGGLFIATNNVIRKIANLRDDVNRPLFVDRGPDGLAGANVPPMTVGFILGYPVMEDNFIPENLGGGANASEIVFANLKRGYVGFDSGSAETKTSEEANDAFLKNQMYVRMLRYDDGKPAIPEAVSFLTGVV